MKIVNIDGEHLHIFPGKMWPMIISKVTKKQAFTLSLEDTFFEKPQRGPFPQPFKGQRLFTATHESFRVVSFIMTPRNVQRWINICQEFKTNCDRNVAEEPSLHTAELLFSGRCCFFLKSWIILGTLVMEAALEWSESSLQIFTDLQIVLFSASRDEYTDHSAAKISTLDFTLLFVFETFTIIHVNKSLIVSEVTLETGLFSDCTKIFFFKQYAQPKKTHLLSTHKQAKIELIKIKKKPEGSRCFAI